MGRSLTLGCATVLACGVCAGIPARTATVAAGPGGPARPLEYLARGEPAVRVVGPGGERVPVLNEPPPGQSGRPLQLKVVAESGATVEASAWRSDSADVAAVDPRSGVVRPVLTGFATIYAQTSRGEAKCFVAVMRVTPQTGGMAQGDTKSDALHRLYVSDPVHHVIYRAAGRTVESWVGAANRPGFGDGEGAAARFSEPSGLAVDLSAQGGLYVADSKNHCVRKVGFDGRVGTRDASSVAVGRAEVEGTVAGAGPVALSEMLLKSPQGVVSTGGNLFVADTGNHCLWYADVARGRVWLVAGQPGEVGHRDGEGDAARLSSPSGLAINARGNLLAVADAGNDRVRLVRVRRTDDGGVVGKVSTLGVASSGKWSEAARAPALDEPRDEFEFNEPRSVSFDGAENVYVIDDLGASVVTRPEEAAPEVVALTESATFTRAVSLTVDGTRALVLDAEAADADRAIQAVTVGAPELTTVTPAASPLQGGGEVIIEGRNFAPESVVTLGDSVVGDFEVVSATRIVLREAPPQVAPGERTLTVLTRGGAGQAAFEVRAKPLGELAVGEITTVAGGLRYAGDGGAAVKGRFAGPDDVAIDSNGNVFVADPRDHRVRRVDAATGLITTVAGTGLAGYNGDGQLATAAHLRSPTGIALDAAGDLYIAEFDGNRVRRVDSTTGLIATVAGTGQYGPDGDGGQAALATLNSPSAVAVDAAGNLYIAEAIRGRVRRVDAAGVITTYAGTGGDGDGGDGGPAELATMRYPIGLAVDAAGNLYIADALNNRVRRVDSAGTITAFAGLGTHGYNGDVRPAISATLDYPSDVAADAAGNVYVADTGNQRVRRVDASTGTISTVAGTGRAGYNGDERPAVAARLSSPTGVALDASGNLFVGDNVNSRLRRVEAATGRIATYAGTGSTAFNGDDRSATSAALNMPGGVAVDLSGNLFVSDTENHRVRRVDAATGQITTCAGTGAPGSGGDGGPAAFASLNEPRDVAVDVAGNLFIADTGNHRVRRVDAGTGRIETYAGTGKPGFGGDGGPATSARLESPLGVAVDAAGNLFVVNGAIRRVDATTRRISLYPESGTFGIVGGASGVAVDALGNLFVADPFYNVVIRVDASTQEIDYVAGTGQFGFSGDNVPATRAPLAEPYDVAVDAAGNLFVAEKLFNRIRTVSAETGLLSTAAGFGGEGYDGDGGRATSGRLAGPRGVAIARGGDLFLADTGNGAIRAVRSAGRFPTTIFVESASYRRRTLALVGAGFGVSGAAVTVNGADVTARVGSQTDTRLELRGSRSQLNLRRGVNQIVVAANGRTTAVFYLEL